MDEHTRIQCHKLLADHGLACLVIVGEDGVILERFGSSEGLSSDDLYSGIIGPYGDPQVTFDALEGQILPRLWQQGPDFAFLHKPASDRMVVIFGTGKTDAVELYEQSKLVDQRVLEIFHA